MKSQITFSFCLVTGHRSVLYYTMGLCYLKGQRIYPETPLANLKLSSIKQNKVSTPVFVD